VEIIALVFIAGIFGGGVSVAFLSLSKRGEGARFESLLVPVTSAIQDLEDRIDHVRKRHAKRDRDAKSEDADLPGFQDRGSALSQVRARMRGGRGVS
jgi:hypothetical protein